MAKDFTLRDARTVALLEPHTPEAKAWADDNIGPDNGYQPYWPTVLIECRYVEAILEGLTADGLTVSC